MIRTSVRLQSPLTYAAVGASLLAVPATAAAVAETPQLNGSGSPIKAKIKRRRIAYGSKVVVAGVAPTSEEGQTITLQYSPASTGRWRQIASEVVPPGGRFRLVGWPLRSGWITTTVTPQPAGGGKGAIGAVSASATTSAPEWVAVTAALRVRRRAVNELGARTVQLRGTLLPSKARQRVQLEADRSGRWVILSAARTDRRGDFILRYRPHGLGRTVLWVRFAGDSANTATSSRAGSVTVYQQSVASWYEDGGTTSCGFHAYYGVANLSLPCGTKVSFFYGGRVVRAVVDDRGPYVAGRVWDLNENTAAALGMAGVVTVWSSR